MTGSARAFAKLCLSNWKLNTASPQRFGRRPALRGMLQYSRRVPTAFRPNQDIRIGTDRERIRRPIDIEHDLRIVDIRKAQILSAFELPESEMAVEAQQICPRLAIDAPIPFCPAQFDGRTDQAMGEPALAKLASNRNTLDFREICKTADADAARRFVADIAEKMRGTEIVAVEFFLVWAVLFGAIDRASNGKCAQHVVNRARDRDADLRRSVGNAVAVIDRGLGIPHRGTLEPMQMRGNAPVYHRARLQAHRFYKARAVLGRRACENIDALIKRRRNFLHDQRQCRGQSARRIYRPGIYPSRPLALAGQKRDIRIGAVKRSFREAAKALRVQHQKCEEALGDWICRIIPAFAGDRPQTVGIVRNHLAYAIRGCNPADCSSAAADYRADCGPPGGEDHEFLSKLPNLQPQYGVPRGSFD